MVFENKIIWNFDIHKILVLIILLLLLIRGEVKVSEYLAIQEDKVHLDNLRLNNEIKEQLPIPYPESYIKTTSGDISGPGYFNSSKAGMSGDINLTNKIQ